MRGAPTKPTTAPDTDSVRRMPRAEIKGTRGTQADGTMLCSALFYFSLLCAAGGHSLAHSFITYPFSAMATATTVTNT